VNCLVSVEDAIPVSLIQSKQESLDDLRCSGKAFRKLLSRPRMPVFGNLLPTGLTLKQLRRFFNRQLARL
jgi:hypothetical protein